MPSLEGFSAEGRTPNGVRARRKALGLTCAELAGRAGVSDVTLWRVEHGHGRPLRSTRLLLAAALGCDPATLFPTQHGDTP